ncbi:hypothetical protein Golomagni_07062, partial [Golovinomyces magnicellulatus]
MKLIITGATGYVGGEVIRQALSNPKVTSIVALGRRETPVPENLGPSADSSKFKSVICEDFNNYTDDVKKEIAGADACLWYVHHHHRLIMILARVKTNCNRLLAVTPAKLKSMDYEDVKKICFDYTVTSLKVLTDQPRGPGQKPLRYIYTSGSAAVRDPKLKPPVLGDYSVMRGQCEVESLQAAEANPEKLETTVIKPGLILSTDPAHESLMAALQEARRHMTVELPKVDLRELSAAALDIAINGNNGKDTYLNADLVEA